MATHYLPFADGSDGAATTFRNTFAHVGGDVVPLETRVAGAEAWAGELGTLARNARIPSQVEAAEGVQAAFRAATSAATGAVTDSVRGPETAPYLTPMPIAWRARELGGRLGGRDLMEGHPVSAPGQWRQWLTRFLRGG